MVCTPSHPIAATANFRRNFFEGKQFDVEQTGLGVMYLAEGVFLYEAEEGGDDNTLFIARLVLAMLKSTYEQYGEFNQPHHHIINVKNDVIALLNEYINTNPDDDFIRYANDICEALLRFD